MNPRTTAVLLAAGAIFGSAFLFVKVLVDEMDAMTIVAARLILGAAAVLAFIVIKRHKLCWTPRLAAKVLVPAVLSLIVPYLLITWAETHIDSGIAAALISTMPLFTALLAAGAFADERLTTARIAGLGAGFAGVLILTDADFDLTSSSALGQLAVIAAAGAYAGGAVFSRKVMRTEEPLSLAGLELLIAAVIAAPLALAVDGTPDSTLSAEAAGSLLAIGIGSTGVAFVAYIWLVDKAGSVRASLVTYVVPVVGLFLGWAVLGEDIGPGAIAGTALITAGTAGAMLGKAPAAQRTAEPAATPAAA